MNKKTFYKNVKVKEMMALPALQKVIDEYVDFPKKVLIKQVREPYKNKDTKETTQKVHAVAGKTLIDVLELDLVLLECSIDPEEAINKEYMIQEYRLALDANMNKGNFQGYAPTGLKIIVTKLEEIKVGEK